MKAKDLAEMLLRNPDAEVCFPRYNGCDLVGAVISSAFLYKKGTLVKNVAGINSCSLADANGKLTEDMFILIRKD